MKNSSSCSPIHQQLLQQRANSKCSKSSSNNNNSSTYSSNWSAVYFPSISAYFWFFIRQSLSASPIFPGKSKFGASHRRRPSSPRGPSPSPPTSADCRRPGAFACGTQFPFRPLPPATATTGSTARDVAETTKSRGGWSAAADRFTTKPAANGPDDGGWLGG